MITLPQSYRRYCQNLPVGTKLWISDELFEELWLSLELEAGPRYYVRSDYLAQWCITYKNTVTIYPKHRYPYTHAD